MSSIPIVFTPELPILRCRESETNGFCSSANLSIAMMELRVTLAKMLYTFDLDMADPDLDWIGKDFDNLPQYVVWVRPTLNVKARLAGE